MMTYSTVNDIFYSTITTL